MTTPTIPQSIETAIKNHESVCFDYERFPRRLGEARINETRAALISAIAGALESRPVDMVLHCPACGLQHVDAPDGNWTNPPHRSHLCAGCKTIWRPADVATNGVVAIKTRGNADTNEWPPR